MNAPNDNSGFQFVSRVLPPVYFDMSAGKAIDPAMRGGLEFVSNVLPPVVFDFRVTPNFILTLHTHPTVEPTTMEADLLDLLASLSEKEKSLGGRGLTWSRTEPTNGTRGIIRLILRPNDPVGASERLNQLAAAVVSLIPTRSFDRCETLVAV